MHYFQRLELDIYLGPSVADITCVTPSRYPPDPPKEGKGLRLSAPRNPSEVVAFAHVPLLTVVEEYRNQLIHARPETGGACNEAGAKGGIGISRKDQVTSPVAEQTVPAAEFAEPPPVHVSMRGRSKWGSP